MVNKIEAVKLREAGHTYSEIAALLECSEIWCRKMLKDVVKGATAPRSGFDTKLQAIKILEKALSDLRGL